MKIEEILAQLNDLQDYCQERTKTEYDDRGTWGDDAEALEEAVKLLWKEVPRKPKILAKYEDSQYMRCSQCKSSTVLYRRMRPSYCPNCGSKLDWSDV